jgi:hypothetical protein
MSACMCEPEDNEAAQMPGLTFEAALVAMKNGARVARRSWTQPGKWVRVVRPEVMSHTYEQEGMATIGISQPADGAPNIALDWGDGGTDVVPVDTADRRPYLEWRRWDGGLEPWLPTHDGLLADDWYIVE